MKLFDIIPDQIFSPLATRSRHIHLKALGVIYEQFRIDWKISKNEIVAILANELKNDVNYYNFDEDDVIEDRSYTGFAYMLLKKLEKYGWIDYETGEKNFEQYIIIPDYALTFLETFRQIENQDSVEYNPLVIASYSSIKVATEEAEGYFSALLAAYRGSKELMSKLTMLLSNVKRYHKKLLEHKEVNELMKEHFDLFKDSIHERIYSSIKTIDSVPRYKNHIINTLNIWLTNNEIMESIIEEGCKRGKFTQDNEGEAYQMIEEIISIYEKIEELIALIDKKNAAYTKATVEKIEYMLNGGESMRSKLLGALKTIAVDDRAKWITRPNVQFISKESLTFPRGPKEKQPKNRLKIVNKISEDSIKDEIDSLTKSNSIKYSQEKVLNYINLKLENIEELTTLELSKIDEHDFYMLILASIREDDKASNYNVIYNDGMITINGYKIPKMMFKKKGNHNV